jgi:hypothetical protein
MSTNLTAIVREGTGTRFVGATHTFQTFGAAQASTLPFDTLVAGASNNNVMTITGSSVGVGTTAPGSKLSVSGGVGIGTSYAGTAAPMDSLIVSGNVGVGTTAPQQSLHVQGNALISSTLTTSNLNVLGTTTTINSYETNTSNVVINNAAGVGPALRVAQTGVGASYPIADFYDNDVSTTVPALRIADGGNVGVGTTAPTAPLHVEGNMYLNGYVGIGVPLPKASLHAVNNCAIGSGYATTAAPTDCLIVSGNVGIGTATPQAKLHVVGSSITYPLMAIIEEQKPNGTDAGLPSNGWNNVRKLNTLVVNTLGLSIPANGVFTLQPGTYYITGSAPAFYDVMRHRIRVYNVTASSTVLNGTNQYSGGNTLCDSRSFIEGVVVITTASSMRMDHYIEYAGGNTNRLGLESTGSGLVEVYARITITRIA